MDATTRREKYLAKISGEDVALPEPVTREEKYLSKIAEQGTGGGLPPGTQGQLVGFGSDGTPTAITPDAAPTAGSSNPVTSGGIFAAIQAAAPYYESGAIIFETEE